MNPINNQKSLTIVDKSFITTEIVLGTIATSTGIVTAILCHSLVTGLPFIIPGIIFASSESLYLWKKNWYASRKEGMETENVKTVNVKTVNVKTVEMLTYSRIRSTYLWNGKKGMKKLGAPLISAWEEEKRKFSQKTTWSLAEISVALNIEKDSIRQIAKTANISLNDDSITKEQIDKVIQKLKDYAGL